MTKKLDEILEDILENERLYWNGEDFKDDYLKKAKAQIKQWAQERKPKKKGLLSKDDFINLIDYKYALKTERHIGHDEAIDQMDKNIEEG